MCRNFVFALACLFLLAGPPGCMSKDRTGNERPAVMASDSQMSVEEMAGEAHARYRRAVEEGRSKDQAVEEVARFLRAQKNVAGVKVLGPDSVRVVFTDGNDLVMFLSKGRL